MGISVEVEAGWKFCNFLIERQISYLSVDQAVTVVFPGEIMQNALIGV